MRNNDKLDKKTWILTTIVCLLPVIAGIILLPKLPDQVATHWDAQGNVNGTQSKFTAAVVFPGILAVVNFFFPALLKMDPKYENMSKKVVNVIWWIIPVVALVCSAFTLANGLGIAVDAALAAPLLCGFIFIVVGNYMPKMSQTYTVGIKLPWTLHDEENWNKTHRMAGFLWVVCGMLILVSAFLPYPFNTYIMSAAFVAMVAVPCLYSYLLYRKSGK